MAPKKPSALDEASSEEEETSVDESESGVPNSLVSQKKNPRKKPDSTPGTSKLSSESQSDSDSDIVRKPQQSKTKKSTSKPSATATTTPAVSGSKRARVTEPKDSRAKKKKKVTYPEPDQKDEENKKSTARGDESKKLIHRLWTDEDDIIILKGMVRYKAKKGCDPYADMGAFHKYIKKYLKTDASKLQLQDKIRRLKKKYETNVRKGNKYYPDKAHDREVFELSNKVWGIRGGGQESGLQFKVVLSNASLTSLMELPISVVKGCESKSLPDSCRELGFPEGVLKVGLERIGDLKVAELEESWNELRVAELEIHLKRAELMRQILEAYRSQQKE